MELISELRKFLRDMDKVLICGIGNENRGDDAFGIYVAERLREEIKSKRVVVFICYEAPESFVSKIIKENPRHIIFIDAIHFEGKPGEVTLADPEETLGEALSTHKMPLRLLVQFLKTQINAKFILLGCQPEQTTLFAPMSDRVKESAEAVVKLLKEIFD